MRGTAEGPQAIREIGERRSDQEADALGDIDVSEPEAHHAAVAQEVDEHGQRAGHEEGHKLTSDHARATGRSGTTGQYAASSAANASGATLLSSSRRYGWPG